MKKDSPEWKEWNRKRLELAEKRRKEVNRIHNSRILKRDREKRKRETAAFNKKRGVIPLSAKFKPNRSKE